MPQLRRKLKRLARGLFGQADPVILMYHRVADVAIDPWGLAVSPANFADQMRTLKRIRTPVSLDEMVGALKAGKPTKGTVAITFDDAYRDVLRHAKPVLAELGIPATVFVVTGKLGQEKGFWWDRLADAVFGGEKPALPPKLTFLDDDGLSLFNRKFREGDREQLHLNLWNVIRMLPADAREAAADEVAAAFGTDKLSDAAIMTSAEIGELIEGDLIRVGAHSVSHPSLPGLSPEEQRAEIGQSRDALAALTGQPIRRLAYPFGDYDDHSVAIADELGFDYAVSVEAGAVTDYGARFRLPRHDIKNWDGAEFGKRLRWLN